MTTIIIIIAVAALVGLGSKIFLKDSSRGGLSDQGGMAPGPGESSSSAKKEKATGSPVEKALKISPGMDTSGASLFRPPPRAHAVHRPKRGAEKNRCPCHDTSYPNRGQRVFGSRENLLYHPVDEKVRPSVSRHLPVNRHAGGSARSAFCGGYHAADHFKIPPYPAPAR